MGKHTLGWGRGSRPRVIAGLMLLVSSLSAEALTHIGSIAGTFSAEKGAATYNIPIEVPPGTAGMEPALTLSYNSQGGAGLAGMGWTLGGLSAISRCGRILAEDGTTSGINYNYTDRYCLDGQRLVLVSGTYGKDGAEYRTLIESGARIISHGATGNGPAYFIIQTKSGQTLEYGKATDAFIRANGHSEALVWAQNKITDATGNYLTVHYIKNDDNSEYYPVKVQYTGNDSAGLVPYASVEINYIERNQKPEGYIGGSYYKMTKILSSVVTKNQNDIHYQYDLIYKHRDDKPSLLTGIKQCAGDGNCLPTTNFTWDEGQFSAQFFTAPESWGSAGTSSLTVQGPLVGDINGDGRSDILVPKGTSVGLLISTGSSYQHIRDIGVGSGTQLGLGDINADGKADLILLRNNQNGLSASGINVRLSTGTNFGSEQNWSSLGDHQPGLNLVVGDVNGDGRADVVARFGKRPEVGETTPLISLAKASLFLSTGNAFTEKALGLISQEGRIELADVNGDGLADWLYNPFAKETTLITTANSGAQNTEQKFSVGLSKGESFESGFLNGSGTQFDTHLLSALTAQELMVGDFTGDGMVDLFSFGALYRSSGVGFERVGNSNVTSLSNTYLTLADANGDGKDDLILSENGELKVALARNPWPDRITGFENGLGESIRISYNRLNTAIHQADTTASYPNVPARSAQLLIDKVSRDNGLGGVVTTSYRYKGAKTDLRGRGFLGFESITTHNQASGITSISHYAQNFPFTGLETSGEVKLSDGTVVQTQSTVLKDQYAGRNYHLPYSEKTVSIKRDTKGLLLEKVTTEQSNLDPYGNIRNIHITTEGGGETYQTLTVNDYANDPTVWHLGRLTKSTVTQIHTDGTQGQRTSAFTYNANGLLATETIEPDSADPTLTLTTTKAYDTFGNLTQETQSGQGIGSRVTETRYDSQGRYPLWSKNAKGHQESYVHNARCGKRVQLTGPNGLKTQWRHDSFCRQIQEERADGTKTSVTRAWIDDSDNPRYRYAVTTWTDGAPMVKALFDRLGRELRKETKGFNNRTIVKDTEYNNLGQVQRVSRPYHLSDKIYWANSQYDALGRIVQLDAPADFGLRAITKTQYDGLITTLIDPKGRQKTTHNNVLGKPIKIEQAEGASLRYRYDPFGNLIETIDAKNNSIRMSYDLGGRKRSMDDPDMGHWAYSYNAAGELVQQTDAKGQTIRISYDALGRMIERSEPEGLSRWTYDTAPHGIGKLAQVTGPNGYTQELNYDALGRPIQTQTNAGGKSFSLSSSYDSYGRVAKTVRPGGLEILNIYDGNGYLTAKRSPAGAISDYEKSHLRDLQDEATRSAQEAAQAAAAYQADLELYENWLNSILPLLKQEAAQQRLNNPPANLNWHQAYKRYIHSGNHNTYLQGPDPILILHGSPDTPIAIPSQEYYQLTDQGDGSYSLTTVSATQWASLQSNLVQQSQSLYFGDYNADGNKDFVYSRAGGGDPLEDPALQQQLAETASEIQEVITLLQANVDDAVARTWQLVAIAERVRDRLNQAKLWEESSNPSEVAAMGNADSGTITYWQANSRDAELRLSGYRTGDGLVTTRHYNGATGHLLNIQTGFERGALIRNLAYNYDVMDNVTSREDQIQGLSERFSYDGLDRITSNSVKGQIDGIDYSHSNDYQYDSLGNITHKSDVGAYSYGSSSRGSNNAGPNALVSAGARHLNYQYDLNGNLLSGGGRILQWDSNNKPIRIEKDGKNIRFNYGPDRKRYLKTSSDGETTHYLDKVYERVEKDGVIQHKHYIYADGEVAAIHIKTVDNGTAQPDRTRYLHRDALGSIDTITDGFGAIVDRMSYDPFGKRRAGNWRHDLAITLPSLTTRGFTGHEHLDDMGLIHMNARVYDPELGRFLSADTYVQDPGDSQSYNRYSYVRNNPLKYTDPSGHFLAALVAGIANLFTAVTTLSTATMIVAGAALGFAVSTITALINGASIGDALRAGAIGAIFGMVSAGVSFGIGEVFSGGFWNLHPVLGGIAKAVAHGVAQGLISTGRGGTFKDGFLPGVFGSLAGRFTSMLEKSGSWLGTSPAGQMLVAATAGGIAAELGGGKFMNGAVTASFVHLFNAKMHGSKKHGVT